MVSDTVSALAGCGSGQSNGSSRAGTIEEAMASKDRFYEIVGGYDYDRMPLWYPLHVVSTVPGEYYIDSGRDGVVSNAIEIAMTDRGVYGRSGRVVIGDTEWPGKFFYISYGTERAEEFKNWDQLRERLKAIGINAEQSRMKPVGKLVDELRKPDTPIIRGRLKGEAKGAVGGWGG